MKFRLLAAAGFVLCLPLSARAQDPYNLHSPVKNLATQTQVTYDQSAAAAAILEGLRQRG